MNTGSQCVLIQVFLLKTEHLAQTEIYSILFIVIQPKNTEVYFCRYLNIEK